MSDDGYAVILAHSTSHAIRLEKLLRARGIVCKMIPVPRQISSDCGVCVRIGRAEVEAARETAERAGIAVHGIVEI
jgi:hypothetical protein